MNPIHEFESERRLRIERNGRDREFQELSQTWLEAAFRRKYVYNFTWLGRPIIQLPQDIIGVQELIWQVRPDLIIETGIAHGGSLILSASMLALLDMSDAIERGTEIQLRRPARRVIGVDIDIRRHNRDAIEGHPLAAWIQMVEGSSIDSAVISQVREISSSFRKVMVLLDSMHTYEHVLSELRAYGPLVSVDSYCLVFDTFVENMPIDLFLDRPWRQGNSPLAAVSHYLQERPEFETDRELPDKLAITSLPGGVLRRIR